MGLLLHGGEVSAVLRESVWGEQEDSTTERCSRLLGLGMNDCSALCSTWPVSHGLGRKFRWLMGC